MTLPGDLPPHVALFAESASRAVVSGAAERASELEDLAVAVRVPISRIGETGGPRLVFDGLAEVTLEEAAAVYEESIPKLLAG